MEIPNLAQRYANRPASTRAYFRNMNEGQLRCLSALIFAGNETDALREAPQRSFFSFGKE
jgi:hypothetical protein